MPQWAVALRGGDNKAGGGQGQAEKVLSGHGRETDGASGPGCDLEDVYPLGGPGCPCGGKGEGSIQWSPQSPGPGTVCVFPNFLPLEPLPGTVGEGCRCRRLTSCNPLPQSCLGVSARTPVTPQGKQDPGWLG